MFAVVGLTGSARGGDGGPIGTGGAGAEEAQGLWFWGHIIAALAVVFFLWGRGVLARGALSKRRGVEDHPWWVWLSCAAMAWLLMGVGGAVGMEVAGPVVDKPTLRQHAVIGTGSFGAGLAGALVLLRLVAVGAPRAGLRVSWGWRGILLGVACGALAWPIVQSLGFVATGLHRGITGRDHDPVGHDMLKMILEGGANPNAMVLLVLAVVAAPLFEEILYRGFVQSWLLRATGSVWAGIAGSAVIFGLAHMGAGMPWYAVATVTVLGGCIAFAFERTRSLGVCVGMHAAFNGANVMVAYWAF